MSYIKEEENDMKVATGYLPEHGYAPARFDLDTKTGVLYVTWTNTGHREPLCGHEGERFTKNTDFVALLSGCGFELD